MDVISLGKAMNTLRDIKELNDDILGENAERHFKTVDHRLDWIEGQADKLLVQGSNQVDLSQGVLDNTELTNGKVKLKKIRETGIGYMQNVIPKMTSNISPSGVVSASSEYSSYYAWRAFDGDTTTHLNAWEPNHTDSPAWLQYDFGKRNEKTIKAYRLTGMIHDSVNTIARNPKNWTFEASNDGVNWVLLDTVVNKTSWVQNEFSSLFEFENNTPYQIYRINISENNGDQFIAIGELEMMESAVQKEYYPQGTWTSPIIDLGIGWKETKELDVLKQETETANILIEIATSLDGISFTDFMPLTEAELPQTRYVKIRAILSAEPSGEATEKILEFDQSNEENILALNEYVIADGQLKLKQDHISSMNEDTAWLESGRLYRKLVKKSDWKMINSLNPK